MPANPFRAKIRQSLADEALQAALDGNAERRRNARLQAYASLPEDLQVLRKRLHDRRSETIARLDFYLEQFTQRAQENGFQLHQAVDAARAVECVLQIARQHGARLVSKSKTMVGEEIHLNQSLEKEDLRVVETDLGEYIVQLRGEPPSHIITPAVHLSRLQVGRTFQEKLGIPFTDEIPALTLAARKVLRQTFLETELGISGVNFAVAENGLICLLTNEGNGRMVTTLPTVHIALLGIERIVPNLDDLALALHLLPRSATGQKLTVYASLLLGPRRAGEPDGPLERHIILVDNGRRRLRDSWLREILYCVRCGACLNACPVFREMGGHAYVGAHGTATPYPGPVGSILSPGLFGVPEFGHLARASSLCGACREACPADIDLPKLLLRVRAEGSGCAPPGGESQQPSKPPSPPPLSLRLGLRLFTWAAASPRRFVVIQRLAGWGGRLFAPRSGWLRLPAFTGWGLSRDFPSPALRPFRARFVSLEAVQPSPLASPASPARPETLPEPAISPPQPLSERFAAELRLLGGQFHACLPSELAQVILGLLQERKIDAIQAWGEGQLPGELLAELSRAGIRVQEEPEPALRLGLTGALAGVAETGSLLMASGPGRPQTASLLPEIHLALLPKERLFATLSQAFSCLRRGELPEAASASVVTLISGPSRTADIEMTLTIGVHGPGELHVVCY